MSRLTKAEELIELAMMFQNSYCGLSIDDIAQKFECSRRSAERMKALLFDMFPDKIEEVPTSDKKKRWRFVKGAMNALISFTADDFANLEYLKGLSSNENRRMVLDELISKIKALTPQRNQRALDTDIEAILESEGFAVRQHSRVKVDTKILDQLRSALLAFKKVRFDYPMSEDVKQITLNPYGIVISDKYYLVGFSEYKSAIRQFKVDKIKNLEVLEEYFERDENFSLQKYSENSFGIYQEDPMNVALEFDKSAAEDVLNYHFHPTQKIKKLENGNVRVKFTSGGTQAICHELFKWGGSVKIRKPKELREIYRGYLKEAMGSI